MFIVLCLISYLANYHSFMTAHSSANKNYIYIPCKHV